MKPRSLRYTGMETQQNFSRMLLMAKILRSCLPFFLNRMAASVWYVSSMPVVLHTGLKDRLQRMQIYKAIRNEENPRQRCVLGSATLT